MQEMLWHLFVIKYLNIYQNKQGPKLFLFSDEKNKSYKSKKAFLAISAGGSNKHFPFYKH